MDNLIHDAAFAYARGLAAEFDDQGDFDHFVGRMRVNRRLKRAFPRYPIACRG